MARRNSSMFEDVFEMCSSAPWWVGVVAAVVFAGMGFAFSANLSDNSLNVIIRPFLRFIFGGLVLVSLIASVVSAVKGLSRRHSGFYPSPQGDANGCPRCGSPMTLRTAKRGVSAGSSFYGCSKYPSCKGTRPA